MVEKIYCHIDSLNCDDGRSGPIAQVFVLTPDSVSPGQTFTLFASGGIANLPPPDVKVAGALGCSQSGCPQNSHQDFNFNMDIFPITVRPPSFGTPQSLGSITGIAPSVSGEYTVGFSAFFTPPGDMENASYQSPVFSYTGENVTVSATACSDSLDNDNDGLSDANDPRCHTNCIISNPSNPGSYTPNHNSETTPPNTTCPTPPTLQLNARAAFFEVVKNFIAFITTKAFAGE